MVFQAASKNSEVRLSGSASQRFNNVSVSSAGLVAFVDRGCVRVDELSGSGSNQRVIESKCIRPSGATVVGQCDFLSVDCLEYLVISSDACVSVYSADCTSLVANLPIEEILVNQEGDNSDDPTRNRHVSALNSIMGSPYIVAGTSDGTIVICELNAKRKRLDVEHTLFGHRRAVTAVTSSMSYLVSGDESGTVVIWDVGNFEQICQFPSMGPPCTSVVLRSKTVVASYASGIVRIYDLAWSRVVAEIDAHCRALNSMAIHVQHDVFATAGEDGFVNIWHLPSKRSNDIELVSSHHFPDKLLVGVSFAKENSSKFVATAYDDKALSIVE